MNWLSLALSTVACWGVFGIFLHAGAAAWLPRGVPHQYKRISHTPGRLLVVISPAGFEDFFIEADGITDLGKVIAISARFGFEVLPPS